MSKNQSMSNRLRKRNKLGFSLVELIVVVAIMAVLVAVLAPALLSYVERSRAQKDTSAMSEVTNAVLLAMSNQDVYDELLVHSTKNNVSCYIDNESEGATHVANSKTTTKEINGIVEQYTFGDGARIADEVQYYGAGNMRGVTITFRPEVGTKSAIYTLSKGIINKFYGGNGSKMESCPTLYNTVRATVGDKVEQTSQTYRNSDYTIFIKMGTTGGAQSSAQDAVQVYGQYSGTNLTAVSDIYTRVAGSRVIDNTPTSAPSITVDMSNMDTAETDGVTDKTYTQQSNAVVEFRSMEEFEDFQFVMFNGSVLDSANYTVRKGSTIVTLKPEYLDTLDADQYDVQIVSKNAVATFELDVVPGKDPTLNHSDVIPEGGKYYRFTNYHWDAYAGIFTWDDLKTYDPGDNFPSLQSGDIYVYGDYVYCYEYAWSDIMSHSSTDVLNNQTSLPICYNVKCDGWAVNFNDYNTQTPGSILESINGEPIKNMDYAFNYMDAISTAPTIPNTVTSMEYTFYGCSALTAAPIIPNSVTNMHSTFYGCALTTAPKIPSSVTNAICTFNFCASITGEIELPCSLLSKNYSFDFCPAQIVYYHVDDCSGSCGK